MIETILAIVEAALHIWEDAAAVKYLAQLAAYKQQYYDESNKPWGQQDNALMDTLRFQIKNLADLVAVQMAASAKKAP